MSELAASALFVGTLFLLLAGGVWVGASLLLTAVLGMFLFTDRPVGDAMALTLWGGQSSWTLTALPLFIWMGEILFRSKLSENLFLGLAPFMRRLPGGGLHINIGASAIFAAISGSSAATVATVGKMAIPELRRNNYPEKMIIGTLAGAGTLGLLIPPSISMIIYGVTVNESITQLFVAALLPGLLLALMFMGYVAGWGMWRGSYGMAGAAARTGGDKLRALGRLAPVLSLIFLVIAAIYSGLATATEAAALGVLGALALSAWQKTLTRDSFAAAVRGAARVSAMIMFILMGADFLSLAMGFTGIPRNLAAGIAEWQLSPLQLIAILTLFYMLLGCFLDGISSIVLTMAVIEPLVRQAGFDMLWFGVYLMAVVEMAQITPPIGFNLFVLRQMTGRGIGYIAAASAPMFAVMTLFIVILTLFPAIATWLPSVMAK